MALMINDKYVKTKKINDLYHRFIRGTDFDGILSAEQGAEALEKADLILIDYTKPKALRYTDLKALWEYTKARRFEDLSQKVFEIFSQYCSDQGIDTE
jgi:hypothetical protein